MSAESVDAATSKTTPVDADEIGLSDSTASFGLKKVTWANLKATLKTYFDTLYAAFKGPTVNTQTASYVLVASDVGKRVVMNSASATTITVNTSLFGAGDTLEILNIGAGVCTITAGTATVSTAGTLALVQNAGGKLYFTSAGVSTFLPTALAAASSSHRNQYVTVSADVVLGSSTITDITGYTLTFTPLSATNTMIVSYDLITQGSATPRIFIDLDGANIYLTDYPLAPGAISGSLRISNLSAVSHTIKLRQLTSGGTSITYAGYGGGFVGHNLMVEELY